LSQKMGPRADQEHPGAPRSTPGAPRSTPGAPRSTQEGLGYENVDFHWFYKLLDEFSMNLSIVSISK